MDISNKKMCKARVAVGQVYLSDTDLGFVTGSFSIRKVSVKIEVCIQNSIHPVCCYPVSDGLEYMRGE